MGQNSRGRGDREAGNSFKFSLVWIIQGKRGGAYSRKETKASL
jgi:hypothetical protein